MGTERLIHWSFVAEPLADGILAEKLAAGLRRRFPRTEFTPPRPYHKFKDSWSFYMTTRLGEASFDEAVLQLIHLGSEIANDWLHTCYPEDEIFQMTFNRGPHSRFRLEALQSIRWISAELGAE